VSEGGQTICAPEEWAAGTRTQDRLRLTPISPGLGKPPLSEEVRALAHPPVAR